MTSRDTARWATLRDAAELYAADRMVMSLTDKDRLDDLTKSCGPWPLNLYQQIDLSSSAQECLSEIAVRAVCPELCAALEAALADAIGMAPANVAAELAYDARRMFERRHPLVRPHGDIDEPLLGE